MQTKDGLFTPEIIDQVAQFIEHLPDLSKKVLALHYCEKMTLPEVALSVDLPQDRVVQIHERAFQELRMLLKHAA